MISVFHTRRSHCASRLTEHLQVSLQVATEYSHSVDSDNTRKFNKNSPQLNTGKVLRWSFTLLQGSDHQDRCGSTHRGSNIRDKDHPDLTKVVVGSFKLQSQHEDFSRRIAEV